MLREETCKRHQRSRSVAGLQPCTAQEQADKACWRCVQDSPAGHFVRNSYCKRVVKTDSEMPAHPSCTLAAAAKVMHMQAAQLRRQATRDVLTPRRTRTDLPRAASGRACRRSAGKSAQPEPWLWSCCASWRRRCCGRCQRRRESSTWAWPPAEPAHQVQRAASVYRQHRNEQKKGVVPAQRSWRASPQQQAPHPSPPAMRHTWLSACGAVCRSEASAYLGLGAALLCRGDERKRSLMQLLRRGRRRMRRRLRGRRQRECAGGHQHAQVALWPRLLARKSHRRSSPRRLQSRQRRVRIGAVLGSHGRGGWRDVVVGRARRGSTVRRSCAWRRKRRRRRHQLLFGRGGSGSLGGLGSGSDSLLLFRLRLHTRVA